MPTNRSRRYRLESTGIPPAQVGQHQRAFDGVAADMDDLDGRITALDASQVAYTPADSADWVSPAPTTVADAIDRLAAAGGVTPVP